MEYLYIYIALYLIRFCKNQSDGPGFQWHFQLPFLVSVFSWIATRRQLCQSPVDWSHGVCGWLVWSGVVCAQACVFICVGMRQSKQCQIETVMWCNTVPALCASVSNQHVSVKLPLIQKRPACSDRSLSSSSSLSLPLSPCVCRRDESCGQCSGLQRCGSSLLDKLKSNRL